MAPLRKEKFYIHSFPLAAREKRHTHPLGADHHKDDISVDFDRVGCQILDDSIAVGGGGDRDYPFSSWKILCYYYRVKRKKRKEKTGRRKEKRVERVGVSKLCIEGAERKSSGIK